MVFELSAILSCFSILQFICPGEMIVGFTCVAGQKMEHQGEENWVLTLQGPGAMTSQSAESVPSVVCC